ncbi:hypothetical protein MN116_007835 [Schistosoma mekongi]|uniref:Lipocalin/cytosolic fatty-acid binding domain-containing protein n=1 Tax=Schistosoma mekongi TaxID=38744 RepID=A0AAE1Z8C4_SCHME|nr:hypothetical protein MN116_007835 [Schistosoma mekongi]
MVSLVGRWIPEESYGCESVIDKIGVDSRMKNLMLSTNPTLTFTLVDNDSMKIKVESEIRNYEISFKFGEEYDDDTIFGIKCKSLCRKLSDNKILITQRLPNGIIEVDHKVNGNIITMVTDNNLLQYPVRY